MTSKAGAQRIHFRRRSRERAGFEIGRAGQDEIVALIQKGKATFLRRQSLRVTLWRLVYNGAEIVVVYDANRKTVVTVLPGAAAAAS